MKAVVRTNGAAEDDTVEDDTVEDDTVEDDTVEDDTVEDGTADAVLVPRETGTAITAESCRKPSKQKWTSSGFRHLLWRSSLYHPEVDA